MNCREINDILDRMLFEETPEEAGIRHHTDHCPSCRERYIKILEARELLALIRSSEPVLQDPADLTESIMAEINHVPGNKSVSVLSVLQRVLAAASVALILLLSYEQHGVVEKIMTLEKQFSEIKGDPRYSDPLRLISSQDLSKTGISFAEIEEILTKKEGKAPLSYTIIKKHFDLKPIK